MVKQSHQAAPADWVGQKGESGVRALKTCSSLTGRTSGLPISVTPYSHPHAVYKLHILRCARCRKTGRNAIRWYKSGTAILKVIVFIRAVALALKDARSATIRADV
jgi:hypothetical protein